MSGKPTSIISKSNQSARGIYRLFHAAFPVDLKFILEFHHPDEGFAKVAIIINQKNCTFVHVAFSGELRR